MLFQSHTRMFALIVERNVERNVTEYYYQLCVCVCSSSGIQKRLEMIRSDVCFKPVTSVLFTAVRCPVYRCPTLKPSFTHTHTRIQTGHTHTHITDIPAGRHDKLPVTLTSQRQTGIQPCLTFFLSWNCKCAASSIPFLL